MADLKKIYSSILEEEFPDQLSITLGNETLVYEKRKWCINGESKGLRYGENPDQPAALYALRKGRINAGGISWRGPGQGLVSELGEAQMLQAGKHPGKTNLTDVDNGINILQYLSEQASAIILKHNNPCGAAWAGEEQGGIAKALEQAFWSDRIAAFGGVIVLNRPVTLACAEMIAANYFEVLAAPDYEDGALDILARRKNLRIMALPGLAQLERLLDSAWLDIKSLTDGGLIVQRSFRNRILADQDFQPATAVGENGLEVAARAPNKQELEDLRFAWAVESGVSSNSVIFAKDGVTLAIGTGEQDRVGCVELAIHKARSKYIDSLAYRELGLSLYELTQKAKADQELAAKLAGFEDEAERKAAGLRGSRLVSDGFFPFRDGVDLAISQGVTAIAQPGGALRDAEVIMACNQAVPQVAMVFTGQRSFRH